MNGVKLLKSLIKLAILPIIISGLACNNVQAITLPRTQLITRQEKRELKRLTIDQLKAIAKPIPMDNLKFYGNPMDSSQYCYVIKDYSKIPIDDNIYYYNISLGPYFIKILNVMPSTFSDVYNKKLVTYHTAEWPFFGANNQHLRFSEYDVENPELYDELIKSNISCYTGEVKGSIEEEANTKADDTMYYHYIETARMRDTISDAICKTDYLYCNYWRGTSTDYKLNNVIITSEDDFADGLSGSVLAKKLNAPILYLGSKDKNNDKTIEYLQKQLNKDGTIYILGGPGTISDSILNNIKSLGFTNIKRIYGNDRYETNKYVNEQLNVPRGTPIIVTSGENYPDALSISSIAAIKQFPIILTNSGFLPDQAKKLLQNIAPNKIYIIGGEGVINNNVKENLKYITKLSDDNIIRLYGNDRYETSLNIVKYFGIDSKYIAFASGKNYTDVLSGSQLAAKYNAPILLLDDNEASVIDYLKNKNDKYTYSIYLSYMYRYEDGSDIIGDIYDREY